MVKTEQMPVTVEVLGHLIYYLSGEYRDGPERAGIPPRNLVGHLPELLDIPVPEIEAIVVNGIIVTDKSTVLRSGDQVVIMPVVSEPTELPGIRESKPYTAVCVFQTSYTSLGAAVGFTGRP